MSERLIPHQESATHHEKAPQHEHEARLARNHEQHHEARHETAEQLPELQQDAKEKARSLHEVAIEREEKTPDTPRFAIDRSVKEASRRRIMKRIQRHLRPDERAFSKVTHNRTVDTISRAAEKTVARPSGLFTGGLLALLGSSAYLWLAKYYGYDYNYLLFLILFAAGLCIGIAAELGWRAVRGKKSPRT